MSTKNELRDQIIREMNARRIDHKTYINSEWLLSEYEKALDAEIDTNTMSTKTDEEILTEFNKTFRGCDQCQYGDGQGEWIERWLRTLITTLRKEQEEAVIKAFKEGQEDGAVNRGERRRIIEQLRTEVQEEAYTKGYNAGLADGTGKPLLAIEQIREEAVAEAVKVTENTSDGYHTFKELYEFRKIYNAALFNEWAKQGKYNVHKSMKHSDGELCFGGGWFIVVATLPTGDISNHYEMKDWGLFQCEEREIAKEWDGHTAKNVVERLQALAPQNTKTDSV